LETAAAFFPMLGKTGTRSFQCLEKLTRNVSKGWKICYFLFQEAATVA
jgi:hypothetical protein